MKNPIIKFLTVAMITILLTVSVNDCRYVNAQVIDNTVNEEVGETQEPVITQELEVTQEPETTQEPEEAQEPEVTQEPEDVESSFDAEAFNAEMSKRILNYNQEILAQTDGVSQEDNAYTPDVIEESSYLTANSFMTLSQSIISNASESVVPDIKELIGTGLLNNGLISEEDYYSDEFQKQINGDENNKFSLKSIAQKILKPFEALKVDAEGDGHNNGAVYLLFVNTNGKALGLPTSTGDPIESKNTYSFSFVFCKDCGQVLYYTCSTQHESINTYYVLNDFGSDGNSTTSGLDTNPTVDIAKNNIDTSDKYYAGQWYYYAPIPADERYYVAGQYIQDVIWTLRQAAGGSNLNTLYSSTLSAIMAKQNAFLPNRTSTAGPSTDYWYTQNGTPIDYTVCRYPIGNTNQSKLISSITAKNTTQTIKYGQALDTTVVATLTDGTTKEFIATSNYSLPDMGSSASSSQSITLSYGGYTCTLNVTTQNYVNGITAQANTDTYYGITPTMYVNVTYATGTVENKQAAMAGFNASPALGTTASGTQTVTLTYNGMANYNGTYLTTTANVTVKNYVTNLTPNTSSETVKYGNGIDLKATATYATGSTQLVPCTSNYNANPSIGKNASGTQTVTLTYNTISKLDGTFMTTTKSVIVENFVSALTPSVANQTVFYKDSIDKTATVTYATGETETVNCTDNYNSTPALGTNASSLQAVTLSYLGMNDSNGNPLTTTTNVTVKNYITNVTATAPTQEVFYGDSIDKTATITYATGANEIVTCNDDYNSTPALGTTASATQAVTLTYLGMTSKTGLHLSDTSDITVKNYVVGLSATEPVQSIHYGDSISTINNNATVTYATGVNELVNCTIKNFSNALGDYILSLEFKGMKDKSGNYLSDTVLLAVVKKELSLDINVSDKTYDGLKDANIIYSLEGAITGDDVKLSLSGEFSDKNAGVNIPIILTGTLTGIDSGNYSVTIPTDLKASITKRTLNVTTNATKEYGKITQPFALEYNGFISGENESNLIGFEAPTAYLKDAYTNDAGIYTIYIEGGNPSNNYSFNYINGVLTVTPPDGINLVKYVVKTPFKDVDVKVTIDNTDIRYMHTTTEGVITLWLTPGKHNIIVEYNGMELEIPIDTDKDNNGGNNGGNNGNGGNGNNGETEKPTLILNINNGDIVITQNGVTQNGITLDFDGKYEIKQNPSKVFTGNNITIESGNIDITLNNVWIDTSDKDKAAFEIKDGATANITIIGDVKLISGGYHAGLEVDKGATAIINGTDNDYLYAKGSNGGAGIGSQAGEDCGTIIIKGGNITAVGDGRGAGIGGNGAEVEINHSTVTTTGGNGIEGDKIDIVNKSYVESTGTEEDGIKGGEVNIIDSIVIAKGKENGISGDPINIKDSTVIAEGENGDGIKGGEVNINNSDVTAHGGQNGISGDPINITDSTVKATGDNGDGLHGGEININNSTVDASGGNKGINGDPLNIDDKSKVTDNGKEVPSKGDSGNSGGAFIPSFPSSSSTRTISVKIDVKKGDILQYSYGKGNSGKWIKVNYPNDSLPIIQNVSMQVDSSANFLWVKKNNMLYFTAINNKKSYSLKKYNAISINKVDSKGFNLNGGLILSDKELNGWITKKGEINASKGYLISSTLSDAKWSTSLKLDSNKIYDFVSFYVKDIKTGRIEYQRVAHVIVDSKDPILNGVTNNKTYRNDVNVSFKDIFSGIKEVMLNGKKVDYTKALKVNKKGKHTITILNNANNEKVINFKITK